MLCADPSGTGRTEEGVSALGFSATRGADGGTDSDEPSRASMAALQGARPWEGSGPLDPARGVGNGLGGKEES